MLLKAKIRKEVAMHTAEWRTGRLGKFTASRIHELMGVKGMGKTGMRYIRTRLSEELTGVSSERYVMTEAIEWGIKYETEAIQEFMRRHDIDNEKTYAITQVLLQDMDDEGNDTRFACTPDIIWVKGEKTGGLHYNVATAEVKCFQQDRHAEMLECRTPADLKEAAPDVYYQTLDQMLIADCLEGYSVFFNPDFRIGKYHEIHYRRAEIIKGKSPLQEDINFMKNRKAEAMEELNQKRNLVLQLT